MSDLVQNIKLPQSYFVVLAESTSTLVDFDEILNLPFLTAALPEDEFVLAPLTRRNFQTSLRFSVLDRSILGVKHKQ